MLPAQPRAFGRRPADSQAVPATLDGKSVAAYFGIGGSRLAGGNLRLIWVAAATLTRYCSLASLIATTPFILWWLGELRRPSSSLC